MIITPWLFQDILTQLREKKLNIVYGFPIVSIFNYDTNYNLVERLLEIAVLTFDWITEFVFVHSFIRLLLKITSKLPLRTFFTLGTAATISTYSGFRSYFFIVSPPPMGLNSSRTFGSRVSIQSRSCSSFGTLFLTTGTSYCTENLPFVHTLSSL